MEKKVTSWRWPRAGVAVAVLVVLLAAIAVLGSQGVSTARADPHPGQSVNVVIIGGSTLNDPCTSFTDANLVLNGGCLPLAGPAGELGDFTFAPMTPADVSAANLAPFDTAVLNVASYGMACDADTLSASQQADLAAFVADGKKLIISDSECVPGVDYSWLPYPFTTNNPGAMGATGTLTIVEENTLSTTNPADPHYIDAVAVATQTDAVGDMNVMVTRDPHWCLDMEGTNFNNVTGPVHTYATYPADSDTGLMIYNGLDQDWQDYDPWLRKIWVQELQQPFDPSGLPCFHHVVEVEADIAIVGQGFFPCKTPNRITVSEDTEATLRKVIHNNGPLGPVEVQAGGFIVAPQGCTAWLKEWPAPVDVPVSVDVTVDEVYVLHCYEPGEKTFEVWNYIWPTDFNVIDPVWFNNSWYTKLTLEAVPPGWVDYAVTSLAPLARSFVNPAGSYIVVYTAAVRNVGTIKDGPAALSLLVPPAHPGCPAPKVELLAPTNLVTLDPGQGTTRRFKVTFYHCADASPPLDYTPTAIISAPGDTVPGNDTMSGTVNVFP